MPLKDDIRPVTWLKNRAADMLDQVNRTHNPVVITQNGKPRAVIQDPESYESMRNALLLLTVLAQREREIDAGKLINQEIVFDRLKKKLRRRKTA